MYRKCIIIIIKVLISLILFTLINIHVIFIYILIFLIMTPDAERFNGLAAMLGFVAAVGAYVTTGQIIPGFF